MNTNDTNPMIDSLTVAAPLAKTAATLSKTLGSSLDEFVVSARQSVIIADCSGSMGETLSNGNTKIAQLREVVAMLRETHPVPVAAFGHMSMAGKSVEVVDRIPESYGGTPLHKAIAFGRMENANHLVVVTDGLPDSQSAALVEARNFGGPIDVFYVGDGYDGVEFAKELARVTGGTANITDLLQPKQLAAGIRALLGDGGGQ